MISFLPSSKQNKILRYTLCLCGKFFHEITKERRAKKKKKKGLEKQLVSTENIIHTRNDKILLCLPLFAEKPSRESITKLNPWFEVVFLSWTTGKSSLFFPPWRDDCSLLARKKFRYRRMTFVLKIASPFLLLLLLLPSRLSIVRDRGYSYVYLNTRYVSLPLSLLIVFFLSTFLLCFFNEERQQPSLANLINKFRQTLLPHRLFSSS